MNKEQAKELLGSDEFAEQVLRFQEFMPALIAMLNEYKEVCEKYNIDSDDLPVTCDFIENHFVPLIEAATKLAGDING